MTQILNGDSGLSARTKINNDLSLVHNVLDYGAEGDGVTNDFAAICAARDDAIAAKGTLKFPPGTYLISAPVTFDDADGLTSIRVEGVGEGSEITGNFNDYLFKRQGDGVNQLTSGIRSIEGLKFRNGHATGGGLMWRGNIGASVGNCTFDANKGLDLSYNQSSLTASCTFGRGQGAASAYDSIGVAFDENCTLLNCDITGFMIGCRFAGVGAQILGNRFEVNDRALLCGVNPPREVSSSEYADGFVILGGSFESNGIAIDMYNCGHFVVGGFKVIGFPGAVIYDGTVVGSTTITGATSGATATCTITAGGVATLSGVSGTFQPGAPGERFTGSGVPTGTYLYDQLTGSAGGNGTYNVRSTPRYGMYLASDWATEGTFSGIACNPNAINYSILVGDTTQRGGLVFMGVAASNASTLGGQAWSLPTKAHTAEFINCNVLPTYTFANLPSGGNVRQGDCYYITDGNQAIIGGNVTAGGGSNRSYVTFDGTNWKRGV